MDLLWSEMVNIVRAATGLLDPFGNGLSVGPNVMRLALTAIQTAIQGERNNREFGSHFGVLCSWFSWRCSLDCESPRPIRTITLELIQGETKTQFLDSHNLLANHFRKKWAKARQTQ
jgi:hypothetical protein